MTKQESDVKEGKIVFSLYIVMVFVIAMAIYFYSTYGVK